MIFWYLLITRAPLRKLYREDFFFRSIAWGAVPITRNRKGTLPIRYERKGYRYAHALTQQFIALMYPTLPRWNMAKGPPKNEDSLGYNYPELCQEIDQTKNTFDTMLLWPKSNKKIWWKCNNGPDHSWEAPISRRTGGSGCPFCSIPPRRVSITNCLETLYPDVSVYWNYEKIGKRYILIACELRNTGTRTSLMTCELRNTGTGTILMTWELRNTGTGTSLITCELRNTGTRTSLVEF